MYKIVFPKSSKVSCLAGRQWLCSVKTNGGCSRFIPAKLLLPSYSSSFLWRGTPPPPFFFCTLLSQLLQVVIASFFFFFFLFPRSLFGWHYAGYKVVERCVSKEERLCNLVLWRCVDSPTDPRGSPSSLSPECSFFFLFIFFFLPPPFFFPFWAVTSPFLISYVFVFTCGGWLDESADDMNTDAFLSCLSLLCWEWIECVTSVLKTSVYRASVVAHCFGQQFLICFILPILVVAHTA